MIKKILCFFIAFCLCLLFTSCKSQPKIQIPPLSEATGLSEEELDEILSSMTLEEKISQMLIVEIENGAPLDSPATGGIILFKDNFGDAQNTKDFIEGLKNQSEYPLIVSVDHEGGKVQRLTSLKSPKATYIPPMENLGETGDTFLAYNTGAVMAKELAALGINVNFAPVVDISRDETGFMGSRCFSTNPNLVSSMAVSLAKGMKETGVIPTFKHFPGHGDTSVDSHESLPIINKTKEQLYAHELIPFISAIENGAQIIMVGHIAVPMVSGDNTPASLSKTVITSLLKEELGFDGLVVTDALDMGALTENYSNAEIYKMTVEAGTDLLLMPEDKDLAIKVIKESFSEERINDSVRRILSFKYKYLTNDSSYPLSCIGSKEHKAVINSFNHNHR